MTYMYSLLDNALQYIVDWFLISTITLSRFRQSKHNVINDVPLKQSKHPSTDLTYDESCICKHFKVCEFWWISNSIL